MTKPKAKAKKGDADKDAGSSGTASEAKVAEGQQQHQGSSSPGTSHKMKDNPTSWYTLEIQAMMHGFGDCRKPLAESARIIEEIVHQQMNSLLLQVSEINASRCAKGIGLEDIVFLLRKDKVKLARLIRFLEFKDIKMSALKGAEDITEEGPEHVPDVTKAAAPIKKRLSMKKQCQEFVAIIDQTGELLALFEEEPLDEVRQEREIRADLRSRSMDTDQYLEFAEARTASFCRSFRSSKFRDWLVKDNLTDVKLNLIALEIFNFMAFETVAQIVDLALLVKRDSNADPSDPVTKALPPRCINQDYPSVRLHSVVKPGSTSVASTPPQSPRISPQPPASPGQCSSHLSPGASSGGHQAAAQIGAKAKPKMLKRKKSAVEISLEHPASHVIQPSDIREAIRRYWQPSGPMTPFSKTDSAYMTRRLLCC